MTIHTDNKETLQNALKRIEELEKHNAKLLALINAERERQEKCNDIHLRTIAELEKENAELDCQKNRNKFCYSCVNATERCFTNEIGCPCEKYKSYKDENAELKEINEGYNRNRDKLIAMGFPTFKSCKEYSGKLTNLQKENAELKKDKEELCHSISEAGKACVYLNERISKAKELLAKWVELYKPKLEDFPKPPIQVDTEQFLKEEEK